MTTLENRREILHKLGRLVRGAERNGMYRYRIDLPETAIAGAVLAFAVCAVLRIDASRSVAAIVAAVTLAVVGWIGYVAIRKPQTYADFIGELLNNYPPLDLEAFKRLQTSALESGKLSTLEVKAWYEVELAAYRRQPGVLPDVLMGGEVAFAKRELG